MSWFELVVDDIRDCFHIPLNSHAFTGHIIVNPFNIKLAPSDTRIPSNALISLHKRS